MPPVGSPSLWAIIFASPVSANDVAVISAANSRARVQVPCHMAICLVPLNTLFGGCEPATASKMGAKMGGDMMSRRRESKAPRAHGRSVRQVTASDRKSDPERGVKLSGCNTRQPEGTDSCLDVLVVGKLFSWPRIFFHSFPRWPEALAFINDRGQNDSRWVFYEFLALEQRLINLKQFGGIKMRDWFMPLPSSDGKHAHILWITWTLCNTNLLSTSGKGT